MSQRLTESQYKNIFSLDKKTLIFNTPHEGNRITSYTKFVTNEDWCDVLKAINSCLSSSKERAKQFNWSYNLTLRYMADLYIEQLGKCPITGEVMSPYRGDWNQKNPYKISIDRIDSSKGYVKGNVILVTHWANNAKNTWPSEILESFIINSYKQLKKNGR